MVPAENRAGDLIDNFESDIGWFSVNDGVMGGRSSGDFTISNNTLMFSGTINTRGGGFSSIRRPLAPGRLTNATGLKLKVRTDGRRYRVLLRNDTRFRGRIVTYQADIPHITTGDWTEVTVEFDDFGASVFGQAVPVEPLNPDSVWSLGFIIADGVDGAFNLEIDQIDVTPHAESWRQGSASRQAE